MVLLVWFLGVRGYKSTQNHLIRKIFFEQISGNHFAMSMFLRTFALSASC